jgi:hypothetical protein
MQRISTQSNRFFFAASNLTIRRQISHLPFAPLRTSFLFPLSEDKLL